MECDCASDLCELRAVEDYEQLARYGISVKGAIVIARYGASWRGIKPKIAAEHGAIGCILYSDPADDGYAVNQVFPDGPMRPAEVCNVAACWMRRPIPATRSHRESVRLPMPAPEARRRPFPTENSVTPISYQDAQPLLAALQGPPFPPIGAGSSITYRIGPSSTKVHLKLAFNWDLKPVYDVVATMRAQKNRMSGCCAATTRCLGEWG